MTSNNSNTNNSNTFIPIPGAFSRGQEAFAARMEETRRFNTDPTQMPPRLPGVPLHIGYLPLDEETAFSRKCVDIDNPASKLVYMSSFHQPILVQRSEENTADKMANLIYKFIYCQEGVIQVPNHGGLERVPTSSLYHSRVRFSTMYGHTVFLTFKLEAVKKSGVDYFQVSTHSAKGLNSMHNLVEARLREYILSGGTVFTKIVPRDLMGQDEIDDCEEYHEITGDTGVVHIPRKRPQLQRWTGMEDDQWMVPQKDT